MADEIEIIEAPELETESVETEETQGEEQESTEGGEQQETVQADDNVSGRDTWSKVKERLKDDPALHRQVKNALHHMDEARRLFPDGIAKAEERLKLIEQLDDNPDDPDYVAGSAPIEDVISNTLAERSFWREFDTAFQQGDAKVVNQMIEANPGAFQKLIPEAMNRFSEINPEGFSAYICRSVSSYLNNAQIPLQLALLERVLPETSEDPGLKTVIEAFKAIKGVVETINDTAKKPIEPKTTQQAQETQNQGDSLEVREMNILHDEWLREIRPRSESFTASEVSKQFPGKKFTAAEITQVRNAVKNEINARTRVDDGYQKKIKSLLKAKNKAAYAMTVESKHKNIIPGAVKRAVDDVLSKRKTSQGRSATTQGNSQQRTQQSTQNQGGAGQFEMIAQSPTRLGLKVDMRRTSNEMMARNEAFIVGRDKPVKWKRP